MSTLDLDPIKERLAAATERLPEEARMDAYYYGFERTGCCPVDAVLSAVAIAGKGSHNTDGWTNRDVYGYYDKRPGLPANPRIDDWTGGSAVELIQLTAKASAEKVKSLSDDLAALISEVERLKEAVIVEQNRRKPWVKLAHQNAQEVKRLRESVRKFSDGLLFGDGITEPAATLNDMVDPIRDAFEAQHDHIECPIICELCGEKLADKTCEHCHGSGADNQAASAAGAWVECEWCGGAGKIHEGCVEKSYADLATENSALRAQIDAVKALHRPAHAVFSWNTNGAKYEDPCPECHGAPGVHPCGCWADTQLEYVCAECHRLGSGSLGVYDYQWPCPTIRALDGEAE